MLASILLPVAEWSQPSSAWDYALWLARQGGRVHALAVIDIKSFEVPVLGTADGFMPSVVSPPIAESHALMENLAKLAGARLDQFANLARERGVRCSTAVKTGIPAEVISREAIAHDMVVMARAGKTPIDKSEERQADSLVSGVLRGSIRPVLVAGKAFPSSGTVTSLMIAFDGSTHAGRALAVAVELATGFGIECMLATVAPSEEAGLEILGPAEAFLSHHGITPKKRAVVGSKPSELLCDVVSEAGADLLIMGAYGRSPIRKMLFGSTTERVLSHCGATVILQS
jgi:nucleotide-binding universal stress UspA family protein